MKYWFCDIDENGNELELFGDDYLKLLKTCMKYSKTFSFKIFGDTTKQVSIPEWIYQYVVPDNVIIANVYKHTGISRKLKIVHVELSPDICQWILNVTNNIWGWLNYEENAPEDPTFYRGDSSVFFSSSIHDGECTLHPRDDEDISNIISNNGWYALPSDEHRKYPNLKHPPVFAIKDTKIFQGCALKNKLDFDELTIGLSLDFVKAMDPNGDFHIIESDEFGDVRISMHYTADGYPVIINYDKTHKITDVSFGKKTGKDRK